ncbi:BPL-N domain-containing protein [Nocardia sp. NPDC051570]|uniref:BPL-N domain-containing protein n=1 Tax=Nocardia sp. NPDC051570 TaxID=3364324 RepID=UPI00379F6AB2
MIRRRTFLIATAAAVTTTAGAGIVATYELHRTPAPLALVYRGPATTPGCPEAVAALLRTTSTRLRVEYVGPHEELDLTAENLSRALIFAQPGGGDVDAAWPRLRRHADTVRDWVRGGGVYLGFCLGGYLAGRPGYQLLAGDAEQYIATPNAVVTTTDDAIMPVNWRGQRRRLYFQDGPTFRIRSGTPIQQLATYPSGEPAAIVTRYGLGRVGLTGPHPEADASWFHPPRLPATDAIHPELGHDLIETTLTIQ